MLASFLPLRPVVVMAPAVLGLSALLLAACATDGADRWPGDGCQPACVDLPGDVEPSQQCLDDNGSHQACVDVNQGFPACRTGTPSCESGRPRCLEEEDERPTCQ